MIIWGLLEMLIDEVLKSDMRISEKENKMFSWFQKYVQRDLTMEEKAFIDRCLHDFKYTSKTAKRPFHVLCDICCRQPEAFSSDLAAEMLLADMSAIVKGREL